MEKHATLNKLVKNRKKYCFKKSTWQSENSWKYPESTEQTEIRLPQTRDRELLSTNGGTGVKTKTHGYRVD